MLRAYQQRAIDQLNAWFKNKGNPCVVMPTGAGKSWVIAGYCKWALTEYPDTRILMVAHVKELIEQNLEKLLNIWPEAPVGVYSASIGKKQINQITFGSIQSLYKKAFDLGYIDFIIIDECHLIGHEETGMYRQLLEELKKLNPNIRIIGFTATPYRLGHGLITKDPALFNNPLIEPVTIQELIAMGYLAPLKSKVTDLVFNTSDIHVRMGDYIESEVNSLINTSENNLKIVRETIALAGERKAWLFFCVNVDHAQKIQIVLEEAGIPAACITGNLTKQERESLLHRFKSGELKAVTNVNVLTTGFDYPNIDLIALARPTMSPVLYTQMVGRGMRPKSHTDHCLVLDFAGIVKQHGPIVAVNYENKETKNKTCSQCQEIISCNQPSCTNCGYVFPSDGGDSGSEGEGNKKETKLKLDAEADIMGEDMDKPLTMMVRDWQWASHVAKSGKNMLKVTYLPKNYLDPRVQEYLALFNGGYATTMAVKKLALLEKQFKTKLLEMSSNDEIEYLEELVEVLNQLPPPTSLKYKLNGKFYEVINKKWDLDDLDDLTDSEFFDKVKKYEYTPPEAVTKITEVTESCICFDCVSRMNGICAQDLILLIEKTELTECEIKITIDPLDYIPF